MRAYNPVPWLRSHPTFSDGLAACTIYAAAIINLVMRWNDTTTAGFRPPDLGQVALLAVAILPVTVRRRMPIPAILVMTVAVLTAQGVPYTEHGEGVGLLIGAYAVAAYAEPRVSWRWGVAYGVVLSGWIGVGMLVDSPNASPEDILATNVIYGTAWILGDNVRRRRERVTDLEERARRLERERTLEERVVRTRERAAIARELHDVIAHSMTVMVVQASGARRAVAKNPNAAMDALRVIEETGRSSLVEMRRILGVLRSDDAPDFAPQPSVSRISELATLEATLPVEVITSGSRRELAPSIDVSAYRIVQEALTNVRKHAGPNANATVHIDYGAHALAVRVDDDGRGAMTLAMPHPPGSSNGLLGMRERVAVCGGTLRTGPRTGGGWTVAATLPYDEVSLADPAPVPDATGAVDGVIA